MVDSSLQNRKQLDFNIYINKGTNIVTANLRFSTQKEREREREREGERVQYQLLTTFARVLLLDYLLLLAGGHPHDAVVGVGDPVRPAHGCEGGWAVCGTLALALPIVSVYTHSAVCTVYFIARVCNRRNMY